MAMAESMADRILAVCEAHWEPHKNNCSGFVRAVAADLGIHLVGQANKIVEFVGKHWREAEDGVAAAKLAADGKFVLAGLADEPNGHIVVVVKGGLDRNRYPHAYWGTQGGIGRRNETTNWSWGPGDRDDVGYYYCDIVRPNPHATGKYVNWGLDDLVKKLRLWRGA
jgi:hypothetical protein